MRWPFNRQKLMVRLISTALFFTIGLHVMISRKQLTVLEIDDQGQPLFKEQKVPNSKIEIEDNRRQLAMYENSDSDADNKNAARPKTTENNAKTTIPNEIFLPTKLSVPKPIMQDIKGTNDKRAQRYDQDDETGFWGCRNRGTFDLSGYPLVDARTIYCGNSKAEDGTGAPGAIQPYLLRKVLDESKPDTQVVNIAIQDEPLVKIEGVDISATSELPTCRRYAVYSSRGVKVQENRTVSLGGGKQYNAGPLVFFPIQLSEQWTLMQFLRTLYTECAVASTQIAVTVKHVSVHGRSVNRPFCVYLRVVGGGIKESYVLWEGICKVKSLPPQVTKCYVNDASL